MAASNDLPPIGSLWRHRVSGERRFVMRAEVSVWTGEPRPPLVAVLEKGKESYVTSTNFPDWLAWQAGAVRIDREEA